MQTALEFSGWCQCGLALHLLVPVIVMCVLSGVVLKSLDAVSVKCLKP